MIPKVQRSTSKIFRILIIRNTVSTKINRKSIIVTKMMIILIIPILFTKISLAATAVTVWAIINNTFSTMHFNVLTASIKASARRKNLGLKTSINGERHNPKTLKILIMRKI